MLVENSLMYNGITYRIKPKWYKFENLEK